jgi:hypothetical protein
MLSKEYLAGLFDGEGCVSIQLKDDWANLTVSIAQAKPLILVLIFTQYPEASIEHGSPTSKCNYLRLYGENSKRFLLDILPYVIVKKRQVEIGLEFIKFFRKKGIYKISQDDKLQRTLLVEELLKDKRGE